MPAMRATLVSFLLAALLQSQVAPPPAPSVLNLTTEGQRVIHDLVETPRFDELRWPDYSDYKKHLKNFYEPLNYQFAWTEGGQITPQARVLIGLFEHADEKGINAVDYDATRWAERLYHLDRGTTESELAKFDLAVSITLMRYISDLHIGRINPRNLRFDLDIESKKYYLPKMLTDIKDSASPAAMLAPIEPPYDDYKRLQSVLQTYRRIAAEAAMEPPLPVVKKLKPGEAYAALPQLARMLTRVGDLSDVAQVDLTRGIYDGELVAAVKRFQSRHGIEANGVIAEKTFTALNVPLGMRVRQIQWALERLRWAPMEFPRPPIIVNIPEFVLRTCDEHGKTTGQMRVVVGKSYGHQTPVFAAEMKYLVFRPYWSVPASIQTTELVPKIAQNPAYLARNNYEVVTPDDKPLTLETVDAVTLAKLRNGSLMIRQKPGTSNALGLVKFMFPNQNNVYLHSTPSQELFSRTRRDFSHGCIRVEDPAKLAAWVLREMPEWTPEKIKAAMNAKDSSQVNLPKPIPIMIIYTTVTVAEDGQVHFFEDLYGHDVTLENALAAGYPYPA